MVRLKLGRQAPLWTADHMRAAYHAGAMLDSLGAPPLASADFVSAVTDLVGKNWGMMLNDSLGCCTASDCGHALMLRTANTGTWLVPKDADIQAVYEASGGYNPADPSTDQGADEAAVCAYMRDVGLLGHKSVGTAPVATGIIDDAALDRIRWAIQLFGSCRLGVNLPSVAERQFDAGVPWAIVQNMTIDGGHDVPAVRYDRQFLYVVTWGGLQKVRWDWLKRFGEEAHAEIFPDFLMSTGLSPAGFDMAALVAHLKELTA